MPFARSISCAVSGGAVASPRQIGRTDRLADDHAIVGLTGSKRLTGGPCQIVIPKIYPEDSGWSTTWTET
jgi:hypothetical protein